MLCARECPDWCIYIDSHKETLPAPEGGRPRQRNVLDRFAIDFSLCMYCGICIEVCPFDALFWSPEFEYAEGDIRNLLHEKDRLASWVETVPPPPAHEVGAEPPKELSATPRRPAGGPAGGAARTAGRSGPRAAGGARGGGETAAEGMAEGSAGSAPPEASARRAAAGTSGASGAAEAAAGVGGAAPSEGASSAAPSEPATGSGGVASPEENGGAPAAQPHAVQEGTPRERPRRAPTNVRAIRPPGSLPKPGEATEAGQGESAPSPTGEQAPEELSTGSGAPPSDPASEEQTSRAEPRRRRMTDPRSIRPPGGLEPAETRESEEE
ncbi:4Fe-4S binding protein [Nonomuraea sp. NPDC050663]|uniref:4Fe-4S binding protein n=1 Tax=Nonomuraea sp. NPDC050663 TaxID=3364370 RepID=UPI00379C0AAD